MIHRTFQIIIGFSILACIQAGLICPLCGSASKVPTNWDRVVSNSPFKTCRSVYFELAMRPIDHPTCAPMQRQYQNICCNGGGGPAPAPAPVPAASNGGYPYCRICRNDDFPGNPNVMISARYVGTYSCGSLYQRGKNGQIPGFMCGPLQDRVYDTCGCGKKPPTNRPTPPPVPRPTPRPTQRPTPHPTRLPTPLPTGRPTQRPTPLPTRVPTPYPTPEPTRLPSVAPTESPSTNPSSHPTRSPSMEPTQEPSSAPSPSPSVSPTDAPTNQYARKSSPTADKDDLRLDRRDFGGRRGLRHDSKDNELPAED